MGWFAKKIVAWSLVTFVLSSAFAQDKLRVRADSWMPFNGTPTDDKPGYAIELAREIFLEHHVTVEYQTLAWDQSLKAAKEGSIDAVVGANKTEAIGLISPEEPLGIPHMALFVAKKSVWRYENLNSLGAVRLGVIAGYSYWTSLDEYIVAHAGPKITVFSGDTPLIDAVKKMNAGELDVVAESVSVFIWNVKAAGFSAANYRPAFIYDGEPVYMAFAKTARGIKFAGWFDEGIRARRKSGALASLLSRYGLEDWSD